MSREAEIRRFVRRHMAPATPVGVLMLPDDVGWEDQEQLIEQFQAASSRKDHWPPIVIGPGTEFHATQVMSRRYEARRLLAVRRVA